MTETQGWMLIITVAVAFVRLGMLLEHIRDRLDRIASNMRSR